MDKAEPRSFSRLCLFCEIMKRLFTILMVIALLDNALASGSQVEIFCPPEHSSTETGELYVVGKTTAPKVALRVNNEPLVIVNVRDSVFHYRVHFGYGINEIEIVPINDSSMTIEGEGSSVEVMYGPQSTRRFRRIYPEYVFHNSTVKSECLDCHRATYENLAHADDSSACLECHTKLAETFKRHAEADDRACVNCHQLGNDLTVRHEDAYLDNPCFGCHPQRREMFKHGYVHGPAAGGDCTVCHDPHGSTFDHALNNPIQILCFSCHQDTEDAIDKRVVHAPFKDAKCDACHDPHATNNRWVLVRNSEQLCLNCHSERGALEMHSHPYNVKPRRKLKVPLELSSAGRLECISCHNPHSSDSEHLLRITQDFTCKGCHEDML